jgi:hypothetical protein
MTLVCHLNKALVLQWPSGRHHQVPEVISPKHCFSARLTDGATCSPQGSTVGTRFITQPFEDGADMRDFLHAVAADPKTKTLRIVVAWAKRSGLVRAADDLRAIRDHGGRVLTIAGVSEGGATEQGLRALIDQTDEAYVFHDAGRTFHPKVYLGESDDRALLLVGSHNLTAGGMAWNYEAGVWLSLDLHVPADRQIRDDVVTYFERLRSDTEVCKALDLTALQAMLADGSLIIQDEDIRSKRIEAQEADAPEDTDSTVATEEQPAQKVFGKSQLKKRPALARPARKPHQAPPRKPAPIIGAVPGDAPAIAAVRRWYKLLGPSDAQHPPGARSHPTGNLKLSQEDFSIDHTTYFRRVLFGGLDWAPSAKIADMEEVWLPFQTVVRDEYLGELNLRVSHWPKRIEGQGNVPTWLHWDDLAARMRAINYVGDYVTLERTDAGAFALTIAPHPIGEFLY